MERSATAQESWERWTARAEDWLLDLAGVRPEHRGPYRGRGEPPLVKRRRPLPPALNRTAGEVHGAGRAWAAQAARYRGLAKARLDGRSFLAAKLAGAIARDPPRGREALWVEMDDRVASGVAKPEEL